MSSSPAVSLACRDGGAWRVVLALLHGLAAASLAAWLVHPALALLGLPVAALAGRRAAPSDPPWLAWDGQVWWLDSRTGRVGIALDLGGWMLLHFRADPLADAMVHGAAGGYPREAWLPLSPAAGAWVPMRSALYAAAAPAGGRPSVAS